MNPVQGARARKCGPDQDLCHEHICQKTSDEFVVSFVVDGSHLFSIVKQDSFVHMLQNAATKKKVNASHSN